MELTFPEVFHPLFTPKRIKSLSGGRGSGKSESVARFIIVKGMQAKGRALCTRELQKSTADSVYKTLTDIIEEYELPNFKIQKGYIYNNKTGYDYIFEGIRNNVQALKSVKGTTHCWCEEGHYLTKESIQILEPTVREPNSEIIYTYNRLLQADPVWVEHGPDSDPSMVWYNHSTWKDNFFFPEVLNQQRLKCLRDNPNDYPHIWGGEPKNLGGTMYDADWFEWTDNIPKENEYDYRFIVVDTAYKDKQITKDEKMTDPDYHVFGYFGVKNKKLYWIDMLRAQLKAIDVEAWSLPFIYPKLGYGFRYVWIEDKGHGIYLNQKFPTLKPYVPVPDEEKLKEIMTRKLDKVERASNSIAMIDRLDKNVIINTGMGVEKVKVIREELIFFPNGVHDDTEDVLCDAIKIAFGEEDRIAALKQLLGR